MTSRMVAPTAPFFGGDPLAQFQFLTGLLYLAVLGGRLTQFVLCGGEIVVPIMGTAGIRMLNVDTRPSGR